MEVSTFICNFAVEIVKNNKNDKDTKQCMVVAELEIGNNREAVSHVPVLTGKDKKLVAIAASFFIH